MDQYGYGWNGTVYPGMVGAGSPTTQAANGIAVSPWLSSDTINMLRKGGANFTLALSEEDIARAQCNHRNLDKTSSLVPHEDGTCTCTVCGYTFNLSDDYTQEQVENACKCVTDILQTIKVIYLSMDPEIGRQFFQIIAFMDKIPKLYEIAAKDFKKYEGVYNMTPGMGTNAFNIFSVLSNPNWGGMAPQYTGYGMPMGYGAAPAPGYGAPAAGMPAPTGYPGMPGYGAVPGYGAMPGATPVPPAPGYGVPQVNAGGNPFYSGYGGAQPPAGYGAPAGQGFALNPQGAAAPAQPTPPPAPTPAPAPAPTAKPDTAPTVTANHKA